MEINEKTSYTTEFDIKLGIHTLRITLKDGQIVEASMPDVPHKSALVYFLNEIKKDTTVLTAILSRIESSATAVTNILTEKQLIEAPIKEVKVL